MFMGYMMAIAAFIMYVTQGDINLLFVSALFYIGSGIGACAGAICEKCENEQK